MTNTIKENEDNLPDVDDIFDNKDSFSEESVTLDDAIIEDKSDSEVDNDTSSSNIPYNITQQQQELKPALNSKFFAIRITGGQEKSQIFYKIR
jgi:hypothetical protein